MEPPPKVRRLLEDLKGTKSDKMQQAAAAVKEAQKTLKSLRKSHERAKHTAWDPSVRVQLVAVLIYTLSQNPHWALCFVRMHQARHASRTTRLPRNVTEEIVRQWRRRFAGEAFFEPMLSTVCHPLREQADMFLMETLVYEFVKQQAAKGCTAPTSTLVMKFVKSWQHRPTCDHVKAWLDKLLHDKTTQKNWSRRFRSNWGLRWGVLVPALPVTQQELKDKVWFQSRALAARSHVQRHLLCTQVCI